VLDDPKNLKFLIDEDLSPSVARYLCEELLIDAVAVRDRGLLGADDHQVLEYAFNEERILVTANVGDFERFALESEVHAGIVFIGNGDLLRHEQIEIVKEAVTAIQIELEAGRDLVNRVLYLAVDGTKKFETLPPAPPEEI
jgi:predicted nuclease of predicted toxin-antitoxin system